MKHRLTRSTVILLKARAILAAVLVLGLSIAFAPGARASTSVTAERTAWFWMSNSKVTTCADDGTVNPCGGASGNGGIFGNGSGAAPPISLGHLGVSLKNGAPDMRAFVYFPVPGLRGSTVNSFVITLLADVKTDTAHAQEHAGENAKPPASTNESAAKINACISRDPWGTAEGDPPYSTTVERPKPDSGGSNEPQIHTVHNEPNFDCSLRAAGTHSADLKTWKFDITNIAQAWASGAEYNEGVALVPVEESATNWIVEFHGAPYVTVNQAGDGEIVYVTAAEAPHATVDYAQGLTLPPPPPPPTVGSVGGGFYPGYQPVPEPVVQPPSSDQVTPAPQPQLPGAIPVALVPKTPAWVLLLLLLVVAAAASLSLFVGGDSYAVGAGIVSNSRVASVLKSRRLAGASSVAAATEAIAAEEEAIAEQDQP